MKKAFSSVFLLFIFCTAFGQQDPQFSQNMFNHMATNPGAAGSGDRICASALIREQWLGMEGHPSSKVFNINAPLTQLESVPSAVGLTILTDNIGFEKNIQLNLSYAYLMKIGRGKLGLGLNLGFINKAFVNTEWIYPGAQSSTPGPGSNSDPSIPNDESAFGLDFAFGTFYHSDKLYLGLSSTHLSEPSLAFNKANIKLKRHYYFTGGYNVQLPNPLFQVIPSIFVLNDGTSTQMNFNMNLLYDNQFWGGVSYRLEDAYTAMVGMELVMGLRIGVAYDFTTSDISTYSNGAFEFLVGYNFQISRESGKTKGDWILNWKH
jgi:type IX secretion system PorP/SprF family membrane protein